MGWGDSVSAVDLVLLEVECCSVLQERADVVFLFPEGSGKEVWAAPSPRQALP